MLITITIVSILAISAVVWLANRILPFAVCPICAGVFLTWVGLVGAHVVGYPIALVIPALLMGGSVVGIAYQLEKKNLDSPVGARMLWKVLFIPAGFVTAYAVLEQLWTVFLFAVTLLFLVSFMFLSSNKKRDSREEIVGDVEKKMKDCC